MRALRFLVLLLVLAANAAGAGVLTKGELVRRFPAPLVVGDKAAEVPAWPLFKQNGTATELVGYVFESADLAPVPGFTGVPPNLLVAIDPKGTFIEVRVLSQHEPVFLDGLGEEPLHAFVQQYKGVSLGQNIDVGGAGGAGRVQLDGVSKATASVRIVNQSVLSAALKVARAKLGFAQGREPGDIARVREDVFEPMSLQALLDAGLVEHLRVPNRDVELLFSGSPGAGLDPEALARPGETFIDLYLAWASVPAVGRNLLDEASWKRLAARLDPGDHALLVMSAGRHGLLANDFVRGSVPQRIALRQDGLPLEMRDLDLELGLRVALPVTEIVALRVIAQAGLDPSQPLDFSLPVTRSKGIVYPEQITRTIPLRYQLPAQLYSKPEPAAPAWLASWRSRAPDLLVLAAALVLLALALAMPRRLARNGRRFAWARRAWLLFTIGFIGYHGQAQLSIVNITGAVQALREGRGLGFMLFDPMTLALWAFVLGTLLPWGRGTFCGWLCPFGALQELAGQLGKALRLPQLRMRRPADLRLKRLKYLVLAAIVAAALLVPALADRLVEVEPFKTAITLGFVRSWPYVAWAAGLLALGMVSYKFFCRYLCPFGAALALLGRVRVFDWIARRAECGAPCQTCRHRCSYGAIAPNGKIEYDECFQCLDCIVIYESDALCAPRILERKRARTISIMPVAGT
ncbi:4Fe-4S binding protein [Massilia yuzhufengensis]|uniref:Regulator of nitric oxide reductase transcription n=1 Tax=Massilia yuzhufengensis TaxID=1164594 RepID=A0A1I1WHM2_9BURK|nr:4Fe-4S binding protein [Massilia yuzhufengensis]SFD94704.1 Regulator of nitric oxide reductase transcription [Massilia yuzhufengensis]